MSTQADPELIARAVALLRAGELVAFPTETVYGLGADALKPVAVAKIFSAKGRPVNHPLIVHLPDADVLNEWAIQIPDEARILAQTSWPGPLTLILKRHPRVPDSVTGGQNNVGLRVPSHPLALELLRAFGSGIAAPSANRFGRISPTLAQHVRDELGDAVPLILDGGPCQVGIESTIIDLSSGAPILLRPGMISPARLETLLGHPVKQPESLHEGARSAGRLTAHYAPRTPLQIAPAAHLPTLIESLRPHNMRIGLLRHTRTLTPHLSRIIDAASNPQDYAHDLYAHLRDLDQSALDMILIESPPDTPEWAPIWDRLKKSAAGAGAASHS